MRLMFSVTVALWFTMHSVASAGIVDPCASTCEFHPSQTPSLLITCPQGDTASMIDQGWWLSLTIVDWNHLPIPDIPAADFWLIDCDPQRNLALCAGSASSTADSSTNAWGRTTMSLGTMAAGGCADGLAPVVQGMVLQDEAVQCGVYCYPVRVRSGDFDANLVIDLVDIALLAQHYFSTYDACYDLNTDGIMDLRDIAVFASHYLHLCS